ncbi:hypothetical protein BCR42DRAFT_370362 [Absidia repens]|uniref:Zn(2)-C6 fungal-type domain-containing protein n=1 Tax=Absidia repens TaxID=90262 RepID=A0A1X2IS49_9FUNG|nr:hypothetical protein BCR42DRAFT_370362 [Absidia repens]
MADDDLKQKRSKPCESCRTHRRKCILKQPNYCERCQRMAIPCYFKLTTKPPATLKKSISASKKNRLFKKIWLLEQEAALLETELHDLSSFVTSAPGTRRKVERDSWQVSIQHMQHKLIMETNISSTIEFLAFVQHVATSFTLQSTSLNPLSRHSQQPPLHITLQVTPFEKALREMFASVSTVPTTEGETPTIQHDNDGDMDLDEWTRIKRQLIDIYFACPHLHNPVLIEPYYRRYMHQHLDDMISWAAAAFVAFSPCHHVENFFRQQQQQQQTSFWSRQMVGEKCRLEAKRLFEDAIFMDWDVVDPAVAISWVFTAHTLAHCHFFTLRNNQARIYTDTAWRLAVQLKPVYVPILRNTKYSSNNNDRQQQQEMIFAETWRRLYLVTRYTEISLNVVNDHRIDVSQLVLHCVDIGFPRVLECEQHNETLSDAVEAFHYLTKLHHVAFLGEGERLSTLSFRLYTGKLATIDSGDVISMQNRFIQWWYGLPMWHRIGLIPLDYIQMDRVHQCPSGRVLRVNAAYYIMLMSTMLRLMQDPEASDLAGASYDRMDSERALLVVSICCDAAIKIYQVLHVRLPCIIELHWLTIVLDTVLILINAKNADIRRRAQQGAHTAKHIFRQQAGKYHSGESTNDHSFARPQQQPAPAAHTPGSSYSGSTGCTSSSSVTTDVSIPQLSSPSSSSTPGEQKSTSSTTHSYTTYHDLLAQQMDAHLATKDSFFTCK